MPGKTLKLSVGALLLSLSLLAGHAGATEEGAQKAAEGNLSSYKVQIQVSSVKESSKIQKLRKLYFHSFPVQAVATIAGAFYLWNHLFASHKLNPVEVFGLDNKHLRTGAVGFVWGTLIPSRNIAGSAFIGAVLGLFSNYQTGISWAAGDALGSLSRHTVDIIAGTDD